MYKKLIVSFSVAFLAFISLSFLNAEAKVEKSSLTEEEKEYLYEVLNFSEIEVNNMPIEEVKFLVENEAEIVSEFHEVFDMSDAGPEGITTLGDISKDDLSLKGGILSVKSDKSGYNAFYAYISYDWLTRPTWKLTDKIAIGFPSALNVYMPTKNGNTIGHSASHWIYNTQTKVTTNYNSNTTPDDSDPSGGVVAAFKPYDTINVNHRLQGRVSQTFYVKNTVNGTSNVRFEYGHRRISGEPSISILPSGISITPHSKTDTQRYFSEFDH